MGDMYDILHTSTGFGGHFGWSKHILVYRRTAAGEVKVLCFNATAIDRECCYSQSEQRTWEPLSRLVSSIMDMAATTHKQMPAPRMPTSDTTRRAKSIWLVPYAGDGPIPSGTGYLFGRTVEWIPLTEILENQQHADLIVKYSVSLLIAANILNAQLDEKK